MMDEYIAAFPDRIKQKLQKLREIIKENAPEATEAIAYGMPTFKLQGNLVHFAAFKNHIGFYPTPSGIKPFAKELSKFKTSKGAIQFPMNEELPVELIKNIVQHRRKENLAKARMR